MYPGAWHLAMSQAALSRGRARRRALQGLRGREQLVEVGHLAGVVAPCAADRTPALDEEGRSFGNVLHAAEHVRDPESPHGVRVPVGDELDLTEVERLAPRGLRPRRVARDRERPHPGRIELRSPVTQELELVRSGRRPGERTMRTRRMDTLRFNWNGERDDPQRWAVWPPPRRHQVTARRPLALEAWFGRVRTGDAVRRRWVPSGNEKQGEAAFEGVTLASGGKAAAYARRAAIAESI